MKLLYNPDNFAVDLQYLNANHETRLRNVLNERFPTTGEAIPNLPENIVKSFIKAAAKTFKFGFKIIGWDLENNDTQKMIYDNLLSAVVKAEQYHRLNKFSAVWVFIDEDEMINFKSLHASDFYVENDVNGKIRLVIIKAGSYLSSESVTKYIFKMYKDGTIYQMEAEDWSSVNPETFQEVKMAGTSLAKKYDVLPFVFFKDDLLIPVLSSLIRIENELLCGDGYSLMSFYIAMIKKIVASGSIPAGEFNKLAEMLGVMTIAAKLPKDSIVTALDMGNTENQMNYIKFTERVLIKRAKSDDVDVSNLTDVLKVESGIAKRQELVPIINGRNEDIMFYTPFLRKIFIIINKISGGKIPIPSGFIFNEMTGYIDVTEKIDIETKEFDLNKKKYDAKVITREMFVMKANNINAAEAKKLIKEIDKETIQNDVFFQGNMQTDNSDNSKDSNSDDINNNEGIKKSDNLNQSNNEDEEMNNKNNENNKTSNVGK